MHHSFANVTTAFQQLSTHVFYWAPRFSIVISLENTVFSSVEKNADTRDVSSYLLQYVNDILHLYKPLQLSDLLLSFQSAEQFDQHVYIWTNLFISSHSLKSQLLKAYDLFYINHTNIFRNRTYILFLRLQFIFMKVIPITIPRQCLRFDHMIHFRNK